MRFDHQQLTLFASEVLSTTGLEPARSRLVAETLVCSDLMGHTTHGLQLLLPYADQLEKGLMRKEGNPELISDRGSSLVWNGRHLPGPYLVQEAINVCLERLTEHPQVMVVIGQSHHIACLAAYLEQVTKRDLMIVIMSSDPGNQTVAPFGGLTGVFSPDPLAYGIPTRGQPILFDSSASLVANGVVMQQHSQNDKLSGPWLMDANGKATDDPKAFFADPPATILPVGGLTLGFKGFGYALLIEALTSGLAGIGRKEKSNQWSASVMVQIIDPEQFGGREPFILEMQHMVENCHASPPRQGFEKVRMPGERGLLLKEKQMREGVNLHPQVFDTVQKCAQKFGVAMVKPM